MEAIGAMDASGNHDCGDRSEWCLSGAICHLVRSQADVGQPTAPDVFRVLAAIRGERRCFPLAPRHRGGSVIYHAFPFPGACTDLELPSA